MQHRKAENNKKEQSTNWAKGSNCVLLWYITHRHNGKRHLFALKWTLCLKNTQITRLESAVRCCRLIFLSWDNFFYITGCELKRAGLRNKPPDPLQPCLCWFKLSITGHSEHRGLKHASSCLSFDCFALNALKMITTADVLRWNLHRPHFNFESWVPSACLPSRTKCRLHQLTHSHCVISPSSG